MGLDARVRYTKMTIRNSMIQLLQEKPFHKITLTEVCKHAEINRTTFYKYYKDIYDWKEQLEQECLDRTSSIIGNCEDTENSDITQLLTQQFQDMQDNAELYSLITSLNFESNVLEIAISMILDKADKETKKHILFDEKADHRRKWDCYYVIYGCLGAIECWLKDGMKEDPHELADYYVSCMKTHFKKSM